MLLPSFILLTSLVSLASLASLVSSGDIPNHKTFADGISKGLHKNDNDCTSSLGISMCFGLVYPGASGDCAQQITTTLHYPTSTSSSLVWGDTSTRLTTKYNGKCTQVVGNGDCMAKNPTVDISNSIWLNGGTLQSSYSAIVGNWSRSIDFTSSDAGKTINDWCKEKTKGLIPSVLGDGPIDGDLVAVNAIYLNASWTKDFQERFTNNDHFYHVTTAKTSSSTPPSSKENAHFMHMVDSFEYGVVGEGESTFQVVRLTYASSSLSMIFALPATAASAVAASLSTGRLTSTKILTALGDLTFTRLALAVPKFQFESKYSETLISTLQELGMKQPFLGGFDGILENKELYVADIIHKTYINVYEKGTEAAAVTALLMRATSVGPKPKNPLLMVLDHPFQFWIYDGSEDVVLFEGHVGAPGIPTGSVAPLLSHHLRENNDAGQDRALFWKEHFYIDVEEDPAVDADAWDGGSGSDGDTSGVSSPSSSATFSMVPGRGLRLFPPQSMLVGFTMVMAMTVLMWTRYL